MAAGAAAPLTLTLPTWWPRVLGLLLSLWVTLPGVVRPTEPGFLGNVNLIFHEAGHVLLMWAGEVVMLLSGSLFQLLVPAACIGVFLARGERFAAGLVTLWLAHSLAGVSAYVADAPLRELPLITGDPDTHDWWQLFTIWNALGWAPGLGRFLHALALGAVVVGVFVALWDDLKEKE